MRAHFQRPARLLAFALLASGFVLAGAANAQAQERGSLQGVVTDGESGRTLVGAQVSLLSGALVVRGTTADRDGLYLLGALEAGSYTLQIRFLGYTDYEAPLLVQEGEGLTVNVQLRPSPIALQGVAVEVEAEAPEVGVVIRDLGRQTVTPGDLRRIPTPAASGDLATFIQTLPGVVSIGDQGGQIFVRGGTHTENMALMDGMLIYQPFHILGAFSAYPEDLVSSVDFYAGGYGARYSGRSSSVLDVQMRDGDRTRYHAGGSIGPVVAEATAEGPLGDRAISWLVSTRRSLIEETAPTLLGRDVPLHFESQFLKMTSFTDDPYSRCALTALRTIDRGRLDPEEPVSRVGWRNFAVGTRCTALLSNSSLRLVNAGISYSKVLNEAITRGAAELESKVGRFQADVNLTNLIGAARVEWGAYARTKRIEHDLIEFFGGERTEDVTWESGLYVEVTPYDGERFTLVPGLVTTILPIVHMEPRLRMAWRPWGREAQKEVTGAFGVYRQPLAGISDVRDASSVFIAWKEYNKDLADPLTSLHAQVGWQQTLRPGLNWSIEAYYRDMRNISVPLWSVTTSFNTELGVAHGESYGLDARVEYSGASFYGFVGYGYASTTYNSAQKYFSVWFGEPVQSYRPPHDRRHQVNVVASVEAGGFLFGSRWQLGSGFPYTRPVGFDEFFDYGTSLPHPQLAWGTTRMVVEKPYLGRLPYMHRLDLSIERNFDFSFGRLEARGGVLNAYDRRNIFFYDLYTHRRVDQLPIFPYLAVRLIGG